MDSNPQISYRYWKKRQPKSPSPSLPPLRRRFPSHQRASCTDKPDMSHGCQAISVYNRDGICVCRAVGWLNNPSPTRSNRWGTRKAAPLPWPERWEALVWTPWRPMGGPPSHPNRAIELPTSNVPRSQSYSV